MYVWSKSFEPYGTARKAPLGGLEDPQLKAAFDRYRRTVAKRYRVVDPPNMERMLPAGPLWISTKVDGELWFLVKRQGDVALATYNGRVLQGTSIDVEAATLLKDRGDTIIAGELFAVPSGQGRARVQHVAKALGESAFAETLAFRAFDLVEDGTEDGLMLPYAARLERLEKLFEKGKKVQVVTTVKGETKDAISYYREWVGTQQFEGIVVRSEQGMTFKIKPTFTLDAVIIAYGERLVDGALQMRELSVALRRDDGDLQLLGPVGNGFTEEGRVEWLQRLQKTEALSSFKMANREGTLCHFVRPEIVIEIQVSDLIESDANDQIVRRVALRYDRATGYSSRGSHPIPAMLFPVFLRERADKITDQPAIGMEQVNARLPARIDDAGSSQQELVPSKVVQRAVYAKELKGQTGVRKYVVIETGKAETHLYPPYAAYFTDFSGGRAEPLKTSVRAASTLEHAQAHVREWMEENVKKGWVEVGHAVNAAEPALDAPLPETPAEPKKPAARKRKAAE